MSTETDTAWEALITDLHRVQTERDAARMVDVHRSRIEAALAARPVAWHNDGDSCSGVLCMNPEHGWGGAGALDAAWTAALAVLPARHSLQLGTNNRGTYEARAVPPFMPYPEWHEALTEGYGDNGPEALRELTAALSARLSGSRS